MRLAKESDLDVLFDLNAISRHDAERSLFIASSVHAGKCWMAVETDDASRLPGYGILNHSFFRQTFIPLDVIKDSARRLDVGTAILSALV